MKKKSKEEVQKCLKGIILKQAKEMQKNKYFIDNINMEGGVIGTGVDKDGCLTNEDSGERTITISYRDKSIKIIGEQE